MVKKSKASTDASTHATTQTKALVSAKPLAARSLSRDEIGLVAGDIWKLLDDQGELSLPAIRKSVEASNDLTVAAVGWLAREDKLEFKASGRTVKLKLR